MSVQSEQTVYFDTIYTSRHPMIAATSDQRSQHLRALAVNALQGADIDPYALGCLAHMIHCRADAIVETITAQTGGLEYSFSSPTDHQTSLTDEFIFNPFADLDRLPSPYDALVRGARGAIQDLLLDPRLLEELPEAEARCVQEHPYELSVLISSLFP